jgi:hypothetical protein
MVLRGSIDFSVDFKTIPESPDDPVAPYIRERGIVSPRIVPLRHRMPNNAVIRVHYADSDRAPPTRSHIHSVLKANRRSDRPTHTRPIGGVRISFIFQNIHVIPRTGPGLDGPQHLHVGDDASIP